MLLEPFSVIILMDISVFTKMADKILFTFTKKTKAPQAPPTTTPAFSKAIS